MADHRVPSQQANLISANTSPHPALHHSHGHVQRNPHVAGHDQQDFHRGGVPQLVGNVVMQGEMQYPRHIDAPNYNVAHYHPLHPPYPEVPYVHTHRDVGVVEPVPAQAYPFAPVSRTFLPRVYIQPNHSVQEVQENHDGHFGYGAQFPAADPPEAFPGVWPHPAPPANMPPADGLRILAGRYLNNPNTRVSLLRIEPGPDGRFEVWIALDLADIL
ncbi:hypothetical protein BJY52DRAFT_1274499 [Lactarius psammicola]|nr:hypothetical protein BJY52DRAFT_1274499 [Lactarius psammicola]